MDIGNLFPSLMLVDSKLHEPPVGDLVRVFSIQTSVERAAQKVSILKSITHEAHAWETSSG
jgi:hypothetical protein